MRWLTNVALTTTLLVGAVGCDNPVTPKVKSFTYPLAMGNQWVYEEQIITDYRGKKPNDTVTFSSTIAVIGVDTVLPGIYEYTLRLGSAPPEGKGPPPEARFLNLPDGMYSRRFQFGSGVPFPKQNANEPTVIFRGQRCQNLQTLFTSLIDPLVYDAAGPGGSADSFSLVLPYPQSLRLRWTCVRIEGDQIQGLDKQIISGETAKNSAGSFDCHVIQWIFDPPVEDVSIVEFISAEGLIRRRMEARNLVMVDYEHPYGGDTADVVWTDELTTFELH